MVGMGVSAKIVWAMIKIAAKTGKKLRLSIYGFLYFCAKTY